MSPPQLMAHAKAWSPTYRRCSSCAKVTGMKVRSASARARTALALSATLTATSPFFMPEVHAAPFGQLTYRDPTGVVSPTDSIDVWVRLTLDPQSSPLTLNSSVPGLGVDPSDVPDSWYALTGAFLSPSTGCWGTFIGPTCSAAYSLQPLGPGYPNGLSDVQDLLLAPGQSYDYLAARFVPVGGYATPGEYIHFEHQLGIVLTGTIPTDYQPLLDEFDNEVYDEDGNTIEVPLSELVGVPTRFYTVVTGMGDFRQTQDSGIAFQRTVVPLPAALPLCASALLTLAALRRRKHRIQPTS